MNARVAFPMTVCCAVAGAALAANALAGASAWMLGAAAALLAAAAVLLPRRASTRAFGDRAAVKLALRLAGHGERTLLVEGATGLRVERIAEALQGGRLQYVAALANGTLILARRR